MPIHYKNCKAAEILDPMGYDARNRMFNDLSRLISRYGVLDKKSKLFVLSVVRHKIEENKL